MRMIMFHQFSPWFIFPTTTFYITFSIVYIIIMFDSKFKSLELLIGTQFTFHASKLSNLFILFSSSNNKFIVFYFWKYRKNNKSLIHFQLHLYNTLKFFIFGFSFNNFKKWEGFFWETVVVSLDQAI